MASQKKSPKKLSKKIIKDHQEYLLRLYVVGNTPNCKTAYDNLKKICDEYFPKTYRIEVVDLLRLPQLAHTDRIIAIPTVVRIHPTPPRRAIGNLSNKEDVLRALDLPSQS